MLLVLFKFIWNLGYGSYFFKNILPMHTGPDQNRFVHKTKKLNLHILMKQSYRKQENILVYHILALFWHYIMILYGFRDPKLGVFRVFALF